MQHWTAQSEPSGSQSFPTWIFSLHSCSDHCWVPSPVCWILYFTPSGAVLVKWGHVLLPSSGKVLAHGQVPKGALQKSTVLSNLSGKYMMNRMTLLWFFKTLFLLYFHILPVQKLSPKLFSPPNIVGGSRLTAYNWMTNDNCPLDSVWRAVRWGLSQQGHQKLKATESCGNIVWLLESFETWVENHPESDFLRLKGISSNPAP